MSDEISQTPGARLRARAAEPGALPLIGVYDVFSATVAGRHFDTLFASGFGLAASHYGLPDIGFIAWPEVVAWVERMVTILPRHLILVDIDDGYADVEVACHVTRRLEEVGAAGIVLEDQRRPRKCGHLGGKQILPLDEFRAKLDRVLATRDELFVVARTDAEDADEAVDRVRSFADAGADAVLVDGIGDLAFLKRLSEELDCALVFNQIAGGRSLDCTLSELAAAGVSLVNYSTPCLFAAQAAIDTALTALAAGDGALTGAAASTVDLAQCKALLDENLVRRHGGARDG